MTSKVFDAEVVIPTKPRKRGPIRRLCDELAKQGIERVSIEGDLFAIADMIVDPRPPKTELDSDAIDVEAVLVETRSDQNPWPGITVICCQIPTHEEWMIGGVMAENREQEREHLAELEALDHADRLCGRCDVCQSVESMKTGLTLDGALAVCDDCNPSQESDQDHDD